MQRNDTVAMNDTMDKKRKSRSEDIVLDLEKRPCCQKSRVITDDLPLFRGITVEEDEETGKVISLHSRSRLDSDRWHGTCMPSLALFPDLQNLELFKCRYISSIHDSLTHLKQLRVLKIIGCRRLQSIPESIDQLDQLEEVREIQRF